MRNQEKKKKRREERSKREREEAKKVQEAISLTLFSARLTELKRWAASPKSFTLDYGDYESDYYTVITPEGEAMSQVREKARETGRERERRGKKTIANTHAFFLFFFYSSLPVTLISF